MYINQYLNIDKLIFYLSCTIIGWLLFWYIIFKLTGFHLLTITINNGILFNGISFHTKRYLISVGSLRFRLWGNSKMTIIDDLTIKLLPNVKNNQKQNTQEKRNDYSFKDPTAPVVNIFPQNRIGKYVVSRLIRHLPKMNLELRQTAIITPSENKTIIEYLKFTTSSKYSKRSNEKITFKAGLYINNVLHHLKTKGDVIKPFQIGGASFEAKFLINFETGVLDDLKTRVNINDSDFLVFNAIKYYFILKDSQETKNNTNNQLTPSQAEIEAKEEHKLQRLENTFKIIHAIVSEINLHIENVKISEIPFVTMENNPDFKEYFNDVRPATCLEMMTKSTSFNFSRMYSDAAGFEVLFNSKRDRPYHLTCSVQLLKVFFASRVELPTGQVDNNTDEILNVPNFALTYKTNILDQVVRARGFKNCVVEIYFSASTPILDLDTRQLSSLLYNLVLLKKWKTIKKLEKLLEKTPTSSSDLQDDDFDGSETSNLKIHPGTPHHKEKINARIWRYLTDYYPHLDIKTVVEQPRLVLRHCEPKKNTQILTFSYSLLNFTLSTTETRDYTSSCQLLLPLVTYYEKPFSDVSDLHGKELVTKRVAHTSYIDIKLEIFKNLTVKLLVDVDKVTIDLTNLDIFTGIYNLLLDVTQIAETDLELGVINKMLNLQFLQLRHELQLRQVSYFKKNVKPTLEQKLFRYLPKWLTRIDLKVTFLNISLGSRSVLIPKKDLSRAESPDFDFDFDDDHELKQIDLKFDSLSIGVAKNSKTSGESTPSTVASSASLETLTILNHDTVYWAVNATLEKLKLSALTDLDGKFSRLLEIPTIKTNVSAICDYYGNNKLITDVKVEKILVDYNRYKLYTLIGSIYLIREFVLAPIKVIKSKVNKDLTKFDSNLSPDPNAAHKITSILDFLHLDFKLDYLDMILCLSKDFKVRLQLNAMQAAYRDRTADLSITFLRGLAESPLVANKWCRLLCLDTLKFKSEITSSIKDLSIELDSDAVRFIQPHQFVVYKFFDNISITVKLVKHLVKLLKDESTKEDLNIVHPNLQKAKLLPFIRFKSKSLKFCVEDDPFETELGMIYQLGKVEQRKRLELYNLFETKASTSHIDTEEYFDNLSRLNRTISQSWIRKVNVYKSKLRSEIIANKDYLLGNEVKLDESLNDDVVTYAYALPLFSVYMDKFQIDISKPKFNIDEVANFIYDFGQGVPKTTEYTLLIPMYMALQLGELRMHLRDYPLPLLHSPRNKDMDETSFKLNGHLVISEAFAKAIEHMRQIDVPLVPEHKHKHKQLNKFEFLVMEKTLASVKLYTDLECVFNSNYPTRIVWGASYNFGIQQMMANFDRFSKPPVDPSTKLGFWDKLKYILHGKCQIRTRKSLEVAFKGSRDPYDLFTTAGGFVLSFRKNVVWDINKDDNSKNYFDITADKVSWYIPNYLAGPLLAWTRSSKNSIYLPNSPNVVNSCFAYYLQDFTGQADFDHAARVFERNVVNLSGGIHFQVGFLLERKDTNGKRTDEFKPHYEVQLFDPKYCEKGHDSYAGFRSQFIHMAISLESTNSSSYNTIHLSPGTFQQFFDWWKLFASNMQLPIRRGKMFGEAKESVKFSQHLFTNKFSFMLKSLFIAHVYRDEIVDINNDRIESIGLRAKVDDFMVDLHQRKEPATLYHEELSKNEKVMKMNFDLGEVVLSGIDLRVMHVSFLQNLYTQSHSNSGDAKSTYNIYDNDHRWFDIMDFQEAFLTSIKDCVRTVDIYPLMYLQRFFYERDTHGGKSEDETAFGKEVIHKCNLGAMNPLETRLNVLVQRLNALQEQVKKLSKTSAPEPVADLKKRILFLQKEISTTKASVKSKMRRTSTINGMNNSENYHNKFTFYNMLLKWNFNCRNLTLKYIHFVKLKSQLRNYLSHKSIETLEKMMDSVNAYNDEDDLSSTSEIIRRFTLEGVKSQTSTSKDITSQQKLDNFNTILRETRPDEKVVEDYLIDVIAPQIQLQSEDYPDSVVLISTPSIKGKILSIMDSRNNANQILLETRYGILLKDANVFVLNKEDIVGCPDMLSISNPYGAKSNWPPWLGTEITQNGKWAGANNLLIEKLSVMTMCYESEILSSKLSPNAQDLDQEEQENYNDDNSKQAPLRLGIDMPSVVITSTSSQYFTLYVIIVSLLFYSEPMSKVIHKKIEKMKFSIDFEDLGALTSRLTKMQQHHKLLKVLSNNYSFRQGKLNNEDLNNYLQVNLERGEIASDIYLLLRTLLTGDFASDTSNNLLMSWLIRADEIILQILEDDRTPIMDLALAQGMYTRKELESGSNINKLHIGTMRGFNLIELARYPDFIKPITESSSQNLIELAWTMNKSVGGIKIIENVFVNAAPLNIKLDEITGDKLMKFITYSNSGNLEDSKIIAVSNEKNKDNIKDNLEDEDYGLITENEGINKGPKFEEMSQSSNMKRSLTMLSSKKSSSSASSNDEIEDNEDVEKMIERSKKYLSVVSLNVNAITLEVTLKLNKGFKRILNVNDFRIDLPEFNITNEIVSYMDISKMLQSMITKMILGHVGRLLGNKMKATKGKSKKIMKKRKRIRSISDVRKEIHVSTERGAD